MKENLNLTLENQPDNVKYSLVWTLSLVRKGLWMAWGSIVTMLLVAVSNPYAEATVPFLWFALLIFPAAGSFVIWKFPGWQSLPLEQRRSVILQGFVVSGVNWFVGVFLMPGDGSVFFILLLEVGWGIIVWKMMRRLYQPPREDEDVLFP
ncbi:MAG TPA: hypothetical protein ENK32_02020 [Anaerolineae bacterium]|nr:hypothetical protein [Anaerolineae bacterium]